MLPYNWLALLITFLVALAWLRMMDYAAHRRWIDSRLSRKIIHIGTGPLFVVCWVLFQNTPDARFLAALVPASFTVQFLLIGLGIIKDEASIQSMTRTGDRREILLGPLFYGLIFVVLTIAFWTDNPIGIVALMVLCGGDGMADIIGSRFGHKKLFWSRDKSWLGSLGMFLGGWFLSLVILAFFEAFGVFQGPFSIYVIPVMLIAFAATIVESFPLINLDNITITLTSVLIGLLVF